VESWTRGSGEAAEELLERARSEAQRALLPECRLRDIWDMEYDKYRFRVLILYVLCSIGNSIPADRPSRNAWEVFI
jgi:hypothetical protein